jgi:YVTN family beta-propeller protein
LGVRSRDTMRSTGFWEQDRIARTDFGSRDLDRIFTSNVNSGTISIIEQLAAPMPPAPSPGAPAGTAPTPSGPGADRAKLGNIPTSRGRARREGFDLSPDGKEIWAANAQDSTVTVIDVASKKVTATSSGGGFEGTA